MVRFPFVRSKTAKKPEEPKEPRFESEPSFADETDLDVSLDADPARVDALWSPADGEASSSDPASSEADDLTETAPMNDPLGEDLEDAPTERALAASEPERPDGGTDRKREANASGGRADGPSVEASAASLAADALRGDSLKEALAQSLADTLAETLAKTLVAIDDKSGFIDKASKDESDDHAVEDDPADGPPNAADAERIDRPRREVSARLDAAETGATGRPIFEAIMPTVSFRGDEAMFEDRAAGPDRRGDEALRADTSADADDADAEALRVESGGGEEAGQEAGDEAGAEDAAPTAADADAGLSAAESDWIATETPVAAGFEQDVDDAALDAPSMSTDDEFGEDASSEPHRLGLGLVRAVARAREAAVAYRDGEQTGEQGSLTTEQEAEPQEPVDIRAGIDSGVEAAERGFPIHDIDAALDDDANNDDDIDHEAINQEALDQEAIDHEAFDEDDVAPPAEIGGGLSVALDRDVSLRGEPIAFDALADAAPDTEEEEEYDEAPSDVAAPPLEEQTRMVEAMLFASETPLSTAELGARMPIGCDPAVAVRRLEQSYETRGVRVVRVAGKWAFRTAPDLAYLMTSEAVEQRKLSKAAIETLAIIAYHQPVTRAEIEEIRQVSVSKGTIDLLMELEWIKLGRRRQTPGRPVTFITTETFLDHFGLESTKDLPGLDELRQAGLLDNRPAIGPSPVEGEALEIELEEEDDEEEARRDERELFA